MSHYPGLTLHDVAWDMVPDWTDRAAKRMYEGAGLCPNDVDVFNPYDGYAPMAQFFLKASGTASNAAMPSRSTRAISGSRDPHPFCSSGGNLGNGRTHTAMYTDSIEQLRGMAGARQVKVRAEAALGAFTTPSNGDWIILGKHPS